MTADRSGRMIPLAALRTDGGTQQRVKLSDEHVRELAEAILAKRKLPPAVAFFDGEHFWLADGFHSKLAHEAAQQDKMTVEVHEGTQRDAILFSVGANAEHGLKRTNKDKRKAVQVLLNDEEWSKWTNRRIADAAGVSEHMVRDIRSDSGATKSHLNGDDEMRRQVDDSSTCGNGEEIPLDDPPSPERRVGRDGKSHPVKKKTPSDASTASAEPMPTPQPEANGREPKSGQPVFDDRIITDLIGKVARAINERGKAIGKTEGYGETVDCHDKTIHAWKRWQKEKA